MIRPETAPWPEETEGSADHAAHEASLFRVAVGFNPDEVGKEAEAYRAFLAQRTEFEAYMKLRVAQTITEHAIPEIDANAVNAYFELAEIITDDPSAINQVPQIILYGKAPRNPMSGRLDPLELTDEEAEPDTIAQALHKAISEDGQPPVTENAVADRSLLPLDILETDAVPYDYQKLVIVQSLKVWFETETGEKVPSWKERENNHHAFYWIRVPANTSKIYVYPELEIPKTGWEWDEKDHILADAIEDIREDNRLEAEAQATDLAEAIQEIKVPAPLPPPRARKDRGLATRIPGGEKKERKAQKGPLPGAAQAETKICKEDSARGRLK